MKYIKILFIIAILQFSNVFADIWDDKQEAIKNTLSSVYKIETYKFDKLIDKISVEKAKEISKKLILIKNNEKYDQYSVKIRLLVDYLELILLDKINFSITKELLLENELNDNDLNSLKLDKIKSKKTFSIFDRDSLIQYKRIRKTWIEDIEKKELKSKLDNYLYVRYIQDINIIDEYIEIHDNNLIKNYFVNNWWKFITLDLSYSEEYSKFQKQTDIDYSKYKYWDECDYKTHYYWKDYCNWFSNFYLYKLNNKLYKIRFNEDFYVTDNVSDLGIFNKWLVNNGFETEILIYNPNSKQYHITNWGYKIEEFRADVYELAINKYWQELASYSDSYNWLPYMVDFLTKKWSTLIDLQSYKYLEGSIDIYKWIWWIQKSYNFYIERGNNWIKWYQLIWKQTCVSNISSEKEFDIYNVFYDKYSDLNIYYTWDSGCEYVVAFWNYSRAEEYMKFNLKESVQEVITIDDNFEFIKFWKRYKVIASKFYKWNDINNTFQQKLWEYNYKLGWYKNEVLLINWSEFYLSEWGYSFKEIN